MSDNHRMYNSPDADLLQAGELMAASLPDDISEFKKFDSTIKDSYPEAIKTGIIRAMAIRPDKVVVQDQATLTQELYAEHDICVNSFQDIAFFVRKAFKGKRTIQRKFGLNDFHHLVNDQNEFVRFMKDFADIVLEYKTELVTAGCNAELIDNISVQASDLAKAITDQKKFMKGRPGVTDERVDHLNDLYLIMLPIDEIAQRIFRKDPARMAKYLIPRPKHHSPDNPDTSNPAPDAPQD